MKAEVKKSLTTEGGELIQTYQIEWMKGGHFLVSRTDTKGPLGESSGLSITGFDPKQKNFQYHSFQSSGISEHGNGTVDGRVWRWTSEPPETERRLQRRFTITELSASKYSLLLEITTDGTEWTTVMSGTAEKQP
jgi:uncharacterized protein DUF1579